ncbi:MAG TPA: glycosyltransferase family 39 protein [Candidatus Sulfotelmatobacter sp.]|nr:glycosyltransferase family 39 protein [Candidatus Sulfotelmatobacter sp.]
MKIAEQIQSVIHTLEVGFGSRVVQMVAITLAVIGLGMRYDISAYHNLDSPDAMDAAQVARNLARGDGFTTKNIRLFSIYLVQKRNRELHPDEVLSTNATDLAGLDQPHPDLANAPVYPVALAGLMKLWPPKWQVDLKHPFWAEGGSFRRYQPDFHIAIFNQLLLLLAVVLTYFLAQKLYNAQIARCAAWLMVGLDMLWKYSVSGESTLLVMVIFLALAWSLLKTEENGRAGNPSVSKMFLLAATVGILAGIGMLTRYSFGWLIVPVVIFVVLFGGRRRQVLAVITMLAFVAVVSPWIARNYLVSGTPLGTAGFAIAENTAPFPGTTLMRSLHPDLADYFYFSSHYAGKKLLDGLASLSKGELFQLGGGWLGMLFFTGLLVVLQRDGARRLRYFTLMCLAIFVIIEPLGRTEFSTLNPETSSENLLVLLTPFVAIFGTGFFFELLDRIEFPSVLARRIVIGILVTLVTKSVVITMLEKRAPTTYPPYDPPDIQKIAGWMQPDELLMSDIPWAVAWYGDSPCVWQSLNANYEFFQLNDYLKTVNGLYLSLNQLDGPFFSEYYQSTPNGWGRFVMGMAVNNQLPDKFPLKNNPFGVLHSGMFLSDRVRW